MNEPRQANHYELEGDYDGSHVTYDTTSISGEPLLSYKGGGFDVSARGGQIRTQEVEAGTLVSIELKAVPDAETVSLSLLLPRVNLGDGPAEIEAVAIVTTAKTSIGGPGLLTGALDSYEVEKLHGTASQVQS